MRRLSEDTNGALLDMAHARLPRIEMEDVGEPLKSGMRDFSEGCLRAEWASAYHPEKVANLAEEFQELAHQKTIEIRASYEALLRVVG